MVKIGYQGIEGSNAEEASKLMAKQLNLSNVEYVPLVTAKQTIYALKSGSVDYAVVATKNTIGGVVKETFDAINNECLQLVSTQLLDIHHCVFKKAETPLDEIKEIASHIQALIQTKEHVKELFPQCTTKEIEDTAIGAKYLKEGKLPSTTAIICRKNAGEQFGLELVYENIEDQKNNRTEFQLFKQRGLKYEN